MVTRKIITVPSQAVDDMRERRLEQEKMLAITMRKLEVADEKVEKLAGVCEFFYKFRLVDPFLFVVISLI